MERVRSRGVRRQAGFTLIDMIFVVALVALLATLAIPGLMRARVTAQSASALGSLKVMNSAQLSFALSCGLGFYAPDLTALGLKPPASAEGFLPVDLTGGPIVIKSGYTISMAGTPVDGAPETCNGLAAGQTSAGYAIVADPIATVAAGQFFGTNTDNVIYEDSASYMTTMPEIGAPATGSPIDR